MNEENYLAHFGIPGMKWYLRRFQNPDGSLTELGRIRYLKGDGKLNEKGEKFFSKHGVKPLDVMTKKELDAKLNKARMMNEYKKLMGATVSEISKPSKKHAIAETLKLAFANSLGELTKKFTDNLFGRMDGSHDRKVAENKASVIASTKKMLEDSLDVEKLKVDTSLFKSGDYKKHTSTMKTQEQQAEEFAQLYKTKLAQLTYDDLMKDNKKYTDAQFMQMFKTYTSVTNKQKIDDDDEEKKK